MAESTLAIVGLAFLVTCVASLISLHLLNTGYRPVRDAVSYYARSRFGVLYIIQAVASGAAAGCLFVVIVESFGVSRSLGLLALALYGLSRLVIPIFPADLPGEEQSSRGRMHVLFAGLAFIAIAVAAGPLTSVQVHDAGLLFATALRVAGLLTQVAAALLLVAIYLRPLRPVIGLVERFLYLGALSWMTLSLAHALR